MHLMTILKDRVETLEELPYDSRSLYYEIQRQRFDEGKSKVFYVEFEHSSLSSRCDILEAYRDDEEGRVYLFCEVHYPIELGERAYLDEDYADSLPGIENEVTSIEKVEIEND